jgi:sigma-B regulation protein RsbU (phosphoserine phosphatase)
MAVTCRLFRSIASYLDKPEEIMTSLNDSLSDGNESNMFCTFFLGILDLQTGEMKYCNAGHNAPVVMHASGKVEYMDVLPNLPLGLFGGFPYEDQKCMLSKGDSLFLYTDGVTEAENVEKELYSDEHLLEFLASYQGEDPKKVVEGVMEDIHRHAIGAEQSDDITVMCLNYK